MQDFVNLFMDYTKEYESPSSFWRWSAYTAIAAMLRFNVYYPHGLGKVYPNIYTILLAESAEYRKDAGPKLVKELLKTVNHTRILEGRGSFQAIVNDLSQEVPHKNGVPIRGGGAIIIAPELAAFFVEDKQLIPNITNWYEFDPEYKESLKGSGTITVKNRCITMLAASNETYLREVYDDRAIYGGLLRRTFMIKPDETRPPLSFMYPGMTSDEMIKMLTSKYDTKLLIDSLNEVKKLNGIVTRTDDAANYYHSWYNELYKKYKTHPDKTGVLQSLHTSALKLAIIIAASNYTTEISETIIQEAIVQVSALKGNYETYIMSAAKSDHAEIATTILIELWNAPNYRMSRKAILFKYWNIITAEQMDTIIATFEQGCLIQQAPENNEVGYKLTQKCVDKFNKK